MQMDEYFGHMLTCDILRSLFLHICTFSNHSSFYIDCAKGTEKILFFFRLFPQYVTLLYFTTNSEYHIES